MELHKHRLIWSLLVLLLVASQAASATTYTISLKTNASSYLSGATVEVTGTVSPPPGSSTGVKITVSNPNGTWVIVNETSVNGATGAFQTEFVTGGTGYWVSGEYTVNATWGAYGSPISATVTFGFTGSTSTTTTTSTSISRSTTTSSSASSTTFTITKSTTTTTSSTSTTSSSTTTTSSVQSTTSSTTTSTTVSSTTIVASDTTSSTVAISTTPSTTTSTISTTSTTAAASSSATTYLLVGVGVVVVLGAVAFLALRSRKG